MRVTLSFGSIDMLEKIAMICWNKLAMRMSMSFGLYIGVILFDQNLE